MLVWLQTANVTEGIAETVELPYEPGGAAFDFTGYTASWRIIQEGKVWTDGAAVLSSGLISVPLAATQTAIPKPTKPQKLNAAGVLEIIAESDTQTIIFNSTLVVARREDTSGGDGPFSGVPPVVEAAAPDVAAAASSAAAAAASALAAAQSANTAITFGLPGPKGWFVDAFGALGDGLNNDFAAFNLAIAALPSYGGELWLRNDGNYIVPSPLTLTTGGRAIVWRCGAGALVNGAHVWNLPGRQESYLRLGRPLVNVTNAAPGDNFYLDMRRQANFTGGTISQQGKVARFENNVGANVGSAGSTNRCNEKAVIAVINSDSDFANSVALTASAQTEAQGAVWSGEFTTLSHAVPATYAHRGIEVNISAVGDDVNRLRRIVNVVSHAENFDTYSATDSIHDGVLVEADTADMYYGVRIKDSTATAAQMRTAGLLIETDAAVVARFDGVTKQGTIRIGGGISAINAQTSEIAFGGANASGTPVVYSSIRAAINDNTAGSEDGSVQVWTTTNGTQTKKLGILNSATNSIEMFVGGALKVVEVGDPDSGGAGFRMLRVTN